MRLGDPEYKRRIELINSIPSNKIDEVDLKNISDEGMRDFELRHLRELTEQALNMDSDEQMAVARVIRVEILFNAVGEYITAQQEKNAQIKNAIKEE